MKPFSRKTSILRRWTKSRLKNPGQKKRWQIHKISMWSKIILENTDLPFLPPTLLTPLFMALLIHREYDLSRLVRATDDSWEHIRGCILNKILYKICVYSSSVLAENNGVLVDQKITKCIAWSSRKMLATHDQQYEAAQTPASTEKKKKKESKATIILKKKQTGEWNIQKKRSALLPAVSKQCTTHRQMMHRSTPKKSDNDDKILLQEKFISYLGAKPFAIYGACTEGVRLIGRELPDDCTIRVWVGMYNTCTLIHVTCMAYYMYSLLLVLCSFPRGTEKNI